jgi:hypothetical protein
MIKISLAVEKFMCAGWLLSLSHLTSWIATGSNLYFANLLATVFNEPTLYRLLIFHVPISQIHFPLPRLFHRIRPIPRPRVTFCNKLVLWWELLALCLTLKLEDHLLSAVCNFLFTIFPATLHIWRLHLHPQPEDVPCHGVGDPCNIVKLLNAVTFALTHYVALCFMSFKTMQIFIMCHFVI